MYVAAVLAGLSSVASADSDQRQALEATLRTGPTAEVIGIVRGAVPNDVRTLDVSSLNHLRTAPSGPGVCEAAVGGDAQLLVLAWHDHSRRSQRIKRRSGEDERAFGMLAVDSMDQGRAAGTCYFIGMPGRLLAFDYEVTEDASVALLQKPEIVERPLLDGIE